MIPMLKLFAQKAISPKSHSPENFIKKGKLCRTSENNGPNLIMLLWRVFQ